LCPQPEDVRHSLGAMQDMRMSGDLGQALQVATRTMSLHPGDDGIMAEAIRTLILCRQTDTAARLYQVFTDASPENNLEPPVLVRLALQMGRTDLLADMPVPDKPSWLAALLQTGNDPAADLVLRDLKISAADGPTIYLFGGTCPYCEHQATIRIRANLLVHLTSLCTSCFGRYAIDYRNIRTFIRERYADYLEMDVGAAEKDLIDHVRPRLMAADGAPDIVRNLGQEYHFLLNEILARYVMADSSLTEVGGR